MKLRYALLALLIWVAGAVDPNELSASDLSATEIPPKTIIGRQLDENAPRFISARIKGGKSTFISGREGSFDIEIFLQYDGETAASVYRWDPNACPIKLWISAPSASGIHFERENKLGRTDLQTLIKFDKPALQTDILTARVKYYFEPQARANHSFLRINVAAAVIGPENVSIEDAGEVLVPIKIDTPLRTKLMVIAVIVVAVFLFIVEWVRVDVVAIMIMVALPELGLLDPRYTFRGLSSNAVIAIIGVMIISFAMNRAGLVNRLIRPVLKIIGKSTSRMMVIFSALIAVISSVMQNTGAAVLFLPAIRNTTSRVLKVPLSSVLMPIGMSAILGGTLTMVGTSPLILLNDLLPPDIRKFGFLELTPIGLALVVSGITYFILSARRLLPKIDPQGGNGSLAGNGDNGQLLSEYRGINGPFELYVPENYRHKGGPEKIVDIRREYLVNIVAIATRRGIEDTAPVPQTTIRSGIGMCAFGPRKNIEQFARDYGLLLRKNPLLLKNHFDPAVAGTQEIVISPRSTLLGKTITEIRFRETFGVNALALYQRGKIYYRELADIPLKAGDAILLHGTWEQFHVLKAHHQNFIITASTEIEIGKPHKAMHALICFVATLALMLLSSFYFQNQAYNPIPLSVCLMAGALGMILSGILTINEAYRAVDWRTVFLLGGLLPLGMAVDQTGTAEWAAVGIVSALGNHMSPLVVLFVLAFLSMGFTMVISNVGACTLLVPLGISIAHQIGIDPRVAAIVVGIGVSNSFILPTHQVNALYMGPGGYRTLDYVKVGGMLSLIYIVVLVAMTYFFFL